MKTLKNYLNIFNILLVAVAFYWRVTRITQQRRGLKGFITPIENNSSPDKRRQSRLLSSILLVLFITGLLMFFFYVSTIPFSNPYLIYDLIATGIGVLLVFCVYLLNRKGHSKIAAVLLIIMISLLLQVDYLKDLIVQTEEFLPSYLFTLMILPVLISAMFLENKYTLMVISGNTLCMVLFTVVFSYQELFTNAFQYGLFVFAFIAIVIIALSVHIKRIEHDRQKQLKKKNEEITYRPEIRS